jgi:DNA-binding NarL/FixJ family response regulator
MRSAASATTQAPPTVIRAAVQHRDRLVRIGLGLVLSQEPDIEVVGDAAMPDQLVALCASARPDVVLLELDAPGQDFVRLVSALRKRQRTIRVVGIHAGLSAADSHRVQQAGVRHSVSYEMGAESIVALLRSRHSAPSVIRLTSVPALAPPLLTARERDVLNLVARGGRSKDIAGYLGISLKTVENHKQRLFRKLGVQNQAHAVSVAMRQGLLTSPVAHA